jgi:thymidylate synthase ThyX
MKSFLESVADVIKEHPAESNRIVTTSEITVRKIREMAGDHMVVAAMMVSSTGEESLQILNKPEEELKGRIKYLMQHRHGTPFEQNAITMFVRAPIFVWREWQRHRIGFCLAGDTEVWTETISRNHGRTVRKRPIAELWRNWHEGIPDSMGRTRLLPSCRNLPLRVLNEDSKFFEIGRMSDIVQSGIKEVIGLSLTDGKRLKCSKDHLILTADGWAKAGDLKAGDMIAVVGKRSAFAGRQIPPSLRQGIGVWTSMQRSSLIQPDDNCYLCSVRLPRKVLVLDHVVPVVKDLQRALDVTNLKPICPACNRIKTAGEQKLARRCNVAGSKFVRLKETPFVVGEEMTYDISMEGQHHNFVANGIVVHNSYNEESGRYKQLEPVFYLPPRDRAMVKVDGWRPGRPKFLTLDQWHQENIHTTAPSDPDRVYEALCHNLRLSYVVSYAAYEANLAMNIDPGLARDCLNVGIYSSCWVTCNARSLMHFLSLRTHEPQAKFPSYPLYEIEVAARIAENFLRMGWPLTYAAWNEMGRVAP